MFLYKKLKIHRCVEWNCWWNEWKYNHNFFLGLQKRYGYRILYFQNMYGIALIKCFSILTLCRVNSIYSHILALPCKLGLNSSTDVVKIHFNWDVSVFGARQLPKSRLKMGKKSNWFCALVRVSVSSLMSLPTAHVIQIETTCVQNELEMLYTSSGERSWMGFDGKGAWHWIGGWMRLPSSLVELNE